jgi:hypothetical protein
MLTPASRAALAIFTDDDSQPHARATITALAAFTRLQHAITQFVPYHRWRSQRLPHHFPARDPDALQVEGFPQL